MSKQLTTTKELAGLKVYGGKKGKSIGMIFENLEDALAKIAWMESIC